VRTGEHKSALKEPIGRIAATTQEESFSIYEAFARGVRINVIFEAPAKAEYKNGAARDTALIRPPHNSQ